MKNTKMVLGVVGLVVLLALYGAVKRTDVTKKDK